MKRVLTKPYNIDGVHIGEPGDILTITDAIPSINESWEDVDGYCNIKNESTGVTYWGTWLDVEMAVMEPLGRMI